MWIFRSPHLHTRKYCNCSSERLKRSICLILFSMNLCFSRFPSYKFQKGKIRWPNVVSKRSSQPILSKNEISNSKCHKQHKHKEVSNCSFSISGWASITNLLSYTNLLILFPIKKTRSISKQSSPTTRSLLGRRADVVPQRHENFHFPNYEYNSFPNEKLSKYLS